MAERTTKKVYNSTNPRRGQGTIQADNRSLRRRLQDAAVKWVKEGRDPLSALLNVGAKTAMGTAAVMNPVAALQALAGITAKNKLDTAIENVTGRSGTQWLSQGLDMNPEIVNLATDIVAGGQGIKTGNRVSSSLSRARAAEDALFANAPKVYPATANTPARVTTRPTGRPTRQQQIERLRQIQGNQRRALASNTRQSTIEGNPEWQAALEDELVSTDRYSPEQLNLIDNTENRLAALEEDTRVMAPYINGNLVDWNEILLERAFADPLYDTGDMGPGWTNLLDAEYNLDMQAPRYRAVTNRLTREDIDALEEEAFENTRPNPVQQQIYDIARDAYDANLNDIEEFSNIADAEDIAALENYRMNPGPRTQRTANRILDQYALGQQLVRMGDYDTAPVETQNRVLDLARRLGIEGEIVAARRNRFIADNFNQLPSHVRQNLYDANTMEELSAEINNANRFIAETQQPVNTPSLPGNNSAEVTQEATYDPSYDPDLDIDNELGLWDEEPVTDENGNILGPSVMSVPFAQPAPSPQTIAAQQPSPSVDNLFDGRIRKEYRHQDLIDNTPEQLAVRDLINEYAKTGRFDSDRYNALSKEAREAFDDLQDNINDFRYKADRNSRAVRPYSRHTNTSLGYYNGVNSASGYINNGVKDIESASFFTPGSNVDELMAYMDNDLTTGDKISIANGSSHLSVNSLPLLIKHISRAINNPEHKGYGIEVGKSKMLNGLGFVKDGSVRRPFIVNEDAAKQVDLLRRMLKGLQDSHNKRYPETPIDFDVDNTVYATQGYRPGSFNFYYPGFTAIHKRFGGLIKR